MGMFDGILGGIVGAEMATVVNGLIQNMAAYKALSLNWNSRAWAARFAHG